MLCMSLRISSSSSVVTSDGHISIAQYFYVVVRQNEIIQSVHVSVISGVSKVSRHFTLDRSVETFHYTGFDVVIFRGKEVHSVFF